MPDDLCRPDAARFDVCGTSDFLAHINNDQLEQARVHDRDGSCVNEVSLAPDGMAMPGDGTIIIARFAKTLHKCSRIARSPALRFSMAS
jgi:hypothetical protein